MFHRAVFALADQRGAGEHDCQHGDVADQFNDRAEPGIVQLGVEAHLQRQLHRHARGGAIALHEGVDLGAEDRLDITGADKGMAHAGGIDIELQHGTTPGKYVTPKPVRPLSTVFQVTEPLDPSK